MDEVRSPSLNANPPASPGTEALASARRRMRRGGRGRRRAEDQAASTAPIGRPFSLVLLFLIAQGLFFFSPLFRLAEVEVLGNARVPDSRVVEKADLAPGSYLWALSRPAIVERLHGLREIKTATVSMGIPGRVVLAVQEREPVAQVSTPRHRDTWYEVDADGVLIRPVKESSRLPRLYLDDEVPTAGKMDPTPILVALQARAWVDPVLPGRVESYEVDDLQAVSVHSRLLGSPVVVHLGRLQSMEYKVHVLRALIERLEKEKRKVASIDLRFSSPVVRPLVPVPSPSPTP